MGYALDNIRVLLIDENAHCRQLLRTILQSVGTRVIDAADGVASGFAIFRRHPYDLVIIDGDLATEGELEVVDLIRRSPVSPNPFVPIIMLSARWNKERVQEARDSGVTEFLAKPFTVDSVLARLEAVIDSPRPFVRTPSYFGPDRRRRSSDDYDGVDRRSRQLEPVGDLAPPDSAPPQRMREGYRDLSPR